MSTTRSLGFVLTALGAVPKLAMAQLCALGAFRLSAGRLTAQFMQDTVLEPDRPSQSLAVWSKHHIGRGHGSVQLRCNVVV